MKKIMTLAIAIMMVIAASAQPTRTQQFSTVKVCTPVRLTIVPGRHYSVNVTSENAELANALSWSIVGGNLYLTATDLQLLENSSEEVHVVVTAPEDVNYEICDGMKKISSWERSLPARPRFSNFPRHRMRR